MKITKLLLFGCLILLSCSKDEQVVAPDTTISKIDLSDAKSLFITNSSSISGGRKASTGSDKIFKVTSEGVVQEVKFVNATGDTLSVDKQPTNIISINPEFLIVIFDGWEGYLVRKSDGALFSLGDYTPSQQFFGSQSRYAGDYISEDDKGNIYFATLSEQLIKIDISNPSQLTVNNHSANGDQVDQYTVDLFGNAVYSGWDAGRSRVKRYRKLAGGFEIFPGDPNTGFDISWTDFSGNMYYCRSDNGTASIQKITSSPFGTTDYGSGNVIGLLACGNGPILKIKNKQKIVTIDGCYGNIYQLYSTDGATNYVPSSTFGLTHIKIEAAGDNFYYLCGTSDANKPVMLKVNPDDNTYSTLLTGDYDVYKINISPDDVVTFNALRLSDGKIVIGQVSSLGEVKILDESLTEEVKVLEKVN